MKMNSSPLFAACVAALTLSVTPLTLFAVDREWGNTGTNFVTNGNWVGGTAPADNISSDIGVFGSAGASTMNPDLGANRSINGFSFLSGARAYSFSGAGIFTIGGGGINHAGGNLQIFSNADLTLDQNQDWNVATAGELRINTSVSGGVGIVLTKLGAGTLTLNGTNSFGQPTSNGLNVEGGTVNLNTAAAPGSARISTGNAVTLDNTSGGAITLSNNNRWRLNNVTATFKGTNDLSLGTGVLETNVANRNLRVDGGILTVGGLASANSGNGVTIAGAGTLIVSGSATSTLSGNLNISGGPQNLTGGTVLVNNSAGSATGTAAVFVNNGGTLGGTGIINTGITNNGVTVIAGGMLAPTAAALSLRMDLGTGSLNVSAAVTASNSQALIFTLGTVSSQITLTNASTLNIGTGVLEFNDFQFTGGTGFAPGTYTLFQTSNTITGSLGANLSGMVGAYNASIGFANSDQNLVLMVVPEPSTGALLLGGVLLLLGMRRRSAVRR